MTKDKSFSGRLWYVLLYVALALMTFGVAGDVGYRLVGTPYTLGRYIAIWLLMIGSWLGLLCACMMYYGVKQSDKDE